MEMCRVQVNPWGHKGLQPICNLYFRRGECQHVEWIDPRDGKVLKAEDLDARGGITTGSGSGLQPRGDRNGPESPRTTNTTRVVIRSSDYAEDLAVRITARDPHER